MEELEEAIEFMALNSDRRLEDPEIIKYKEIIERNKENENINEILSRQFRPTSISIDTGGSYLWGCSQNYYGNVSKTCSPLCFEGIGYQATTCQYQIWTYNGKLKKNSEIYSSQAYIYVSDDWEGFQTTDIEILKENNVFFVSVFATIDSKHKLIIPMTSVENLPIVKKQNYSKKEESKSGSYIFPFLFLCLLLLLFYFFKIKT